jgi:uncharacterized membrane protein
MNDAHLHLIVNHFPIIGTILGLGILITGMLLKNDSVKNTAYVLFVIAAIFGALSMATGEGAEEIVEDFPNIGKAIIHEHEELAEKLALVLYILGGFSVLALFLNIKKNSKEKFVSFFILGVGLVSLFLIQKVGTSGGEIRHTEIREDSAVSIPLQETQPTTKKYNEENE